jgi:hypothetical protein
MKWIWDPDLAERLIVQVNEICPLLSDCDMKRVRILQVDKAPNVRPPLGTRTSAIPKANFEVLKVAAPSSASRIPTSNMNAVVNVAEFLVAVSGLHKHQTGPSVSGEPPLIWFFPCQP